MTPFMDIYTNNSLRFGSRSLMLHTLDGNLTGLVHSGAEILEFGIAPDRIKAPSTPRWATWYTHDPTTSSTGR